jgi:hypothetical protein
MLPATWSALGSHMTNVNAGGVLGRYIESVLLAILFALASVAPVALALQTGLDRMVIESVGWHPLGTGQALALALGAVIPAAVLGGAIGGLVWVRRPVLAPVTAVTVSWFVGIVALPAVATWLDVPLRAGFDCFLSCTAHLRDGQPGGGATAYAESLVGIPIAIYLLIVPVVLFLVARRTRHPAVWVAAWLSLHAAIHPFSIAGAAPIYAVLVVGVVLWSAWLWARDARTPRLRGLVRRWAVAIVPVAVIIATTWGAAAISWVPTVPVGVQGVRIGTATVQGFNPPDPSDWFPQIIVPRTPAGSGCFDPVVRPAGRLDVCWEAYRDNREHLPGADYYQFRLIATLHATAPSTWVDISIIPVGDERTRVAHLWPSGVLDGPCRSAAVEGMDFLTNGEMTHDVANDLACGRTTAARADARQRHWVIWTCARCGADEEEGRQVAIRELVATSQGGVPTWQVYAELGP